MILALGHHLHAVSPQQIQAVPSPDRHIETSTFQDVGDEVYKGSIEAIKLTGDPNVPRGEHTFIADDIGAAGFIRVAQEPPFQGARIVKCRGHIAARGFQEGDLSNEALGRIANSTFPDEFIPSQLIMISRNKLAQYWVPFGHISFYERVDIDRLSASGLNPNSQD
jgi:hypothetical protein